MLDGTRLGFVANEDNKYIGQVDLVFENEDPDYTIHGERVYLSRLIVKKENRRQGIGKALSEYALKYASEKGYSEVSLGVDLDNYEAINLYWKLGFDKVLFVGEDDDGKYMKLLKQL